MISTGFHDTFTQDTVRKNVAGATALKREGTSEEVANVVYFLASKESSFNGQVNDSKNTNLEFGYSSTLSLLMLLLR